MALPDYFGKIKKHLSAGVVLAMSLLAASGCNAESSSQIAETHTKTADQVLTAAQPESRGADSTPAKAELPLIDNESVAGALPWIIDTLNLDKRYRKNDLQIDAYEISPDRRYAIVNISNGALAGTSGPFYRFIVFNPKAKRIFFPSMSMLRSDNLGYPYIAAKFNNRDRLFIAYGYRSITADTVMLPDGKILTSRELEVFEVDEIERELARMAEQAR